MSTYIKNLHKLLLSTLLVFSVNHSSATAATNTPLPAIDFYQMRAMQNVKVSPDGNYIVALQNIADTTAILIINIVTGETFYPAKTDNNKFKFNWVDWANNDRLLVSVRYAMKAERASFSYYETRLVSMDAKKPSEMVNMVRPPAYDQAVVYGGRSDSQFQDHVLGRVPGDPNQIFLSVDQDVPYLPSVYKVNVNNGLASIVKKANSKVFEWYLDAQGVVRAGTGFDDKTHLVTITILDPKTNKWGTAWEYKKFDDPDMRVLGFGKNPSDLYLLADYNGRQSVYKVDLSKEGYPKELILSDENRDIEGKLIYARELNDVVGIYYNDGDNKSIFWQADYKKFQAGLDRVLAGSSNHITSLSDDGRKYTLYSSNGITPGTYYYGNRDTKQLVPIGNIFPNLTENVLVKKEFLTFKARDGLVLDGYLSRPKNTSNKPIATIILPHGGPMAEDGAEFDSFSAFLANRGYAVFQPNFRGSSGRGHEFMMKAVGGMGLAMQDDLEDAVKFLVDKNIADPKRLGIVGASYGGYAALMGAAKTPDLFQCAISFAGLSDLVKFRKMYTYKGIARTQIGNDEDQLEKTSPINLVDNIKIPILLIHGTKDVAVPVEQSRLMADELKDKKKVYEYIELDEGSHYLDNFQHRKQTFEAMESFLAKYLPL